MTVTISRNQTTQLNVPMTPVPSGSAFYVSPSGNDSNNGSIGTPWKTAQHAASVAMGGATVYFRAGTYNEHNINVANSGAPGTGGRITFTNYPGEVAIFDAGGSSNDGWVIAGKSYITLNGLGMVIRNCWIGVSIMRASSSHAKATNCDVTGVEIYNLYYAGIHLWNGCDTINILSNNIHDGLGTGDATNNMYGIATEKLGEIDTVAPSCDNIVIDKNRVSGIPLHEGIDCHGGIHIQITNNVVDNIGFADHNNSTGILCDMVLQDNSTPVTNISNWVIDNNTVTRVWGNPIYVGLATNGTNRSLTTVSVSGNHVSTWDGVAIHVFAEGSGNTLSSVTVNGNIIAQHTGTYEWAAGIYVSGDVPVNSLVLTNNSIDGSGNGTYLPEIGIHLDGVHGLQKSGNTVVNCSTAEIDNRIT